MGKSNVESSNGGVNVSTQKLGKIVNSKSFFAGLVLTTLVGCGGGSSGSGPKKPPVIDIPPETPITLPAQIAGKNIPVDALEITGSDGTVIYLDKKDFTQSKFNALPTGNLSYKIISNGAEIYAFPASKTDIKTNSTNEFIDYIVRNGLDEKAISSFLSYISFPDINNDGVLDRKDLKESLPSDYEIPVGFLNYGINLTYGSDLTNPTKGLFESVNLVSTQITYEQELVKVSFQPAYAAGEVAYYVYDDVVIDFDLSELLSKKTAHTFGVVQKSSENGFYAIADSEVILFPGDTIVYFEQTPDGWQTPAKEITNPRNAPILEQTTFSLKEDGRIVANLIEQNGREIQNVTIVTPPTKGIFVVDDLDVSGADIGGIDFNKIFFSYTPFANQHGTDTTKISYEVDGKKYHAYLTFEIESVNDVPEPTGYNFGNVDFGAQIILPVSVFATDVDGDQLTITQVTSDVGEVSINDDGELVFVGTTSGSGTVTLLITDGHSAPITVVAQVNVGEEDIEVPPVDKTELNQLIAHASTFQESHYISGWTAFQTALQAAIDGSNNPEIDQNKVKKLTTDLQTAIEALELDSSIPTATPSYSITTPTNGNVTVTLTMSKDIPGMIAGWIKVNNTTFTKVYFSNENETVSFSDEANNTGSVNVVVNNIDKVVPTGSVGYSTTAPTNGSVLVTINLNEDATNTPAGWTRVDARTFTKTYSSNASETVSFSDEANNTGSVNVVVNNIDTGGPTATPSYSTTALTNGDVTVTINLNEDATNTPAGWTRVDARTFTKTYSSNASETVSFSDEANNTGSVNVVVNNIDKVVPTGSVGYSTTAPTNGSVLVTINLNEDATNTPAGWTRVDARTFTKTYSSNASETVSFSDEANNTGSVNVVVNNIDTIAPTSCTWASVSAIPSEQASLYTGLSFDCGENLTGGTITSITANNGGLVNNITINAQGNPQFDLTTPNSSSTRINIKGTDAGGNPFDKDRVVSFLNAAPTASDFSVNASAGGSVFVDFTPYINDSEDEKDLEIEFVTYPAGFYFGNHTTTDLTNVGIGTSPGYQGTAILTYRVKDSNGRYSNVGTLTITNISN